MDLFDQINDYSSLILVVATIVYVVFTYKLSKETTKLREVETSPFISITLEPFDNSPILSLVIKNIGKAPAYNINFSIDKEFEEFFSYNFENRIAYFSPQQEIVIFGQQYGEFENLSCNSIPIKVTYYSKDKKRFDETFQLEWQYLSKTLLGTDQIAKISDNLAKTVDELKKLNTTLKEKSYTVTERIKIVELEITDLFVKFIFSNGYIDKIAIADIQQLKLNDPKSLHLSDGSLVDYSIHKKFTAEEIFDTLKKLQSRYTKQNIR